jgi:Cdc37 Hsp90 binding domain
MQQCVTLAALPARIAVLLPQDFLMKEGRVLFAEHAQNILLMSCLDAEMEGKHSRAELVGRQSQVLLNSITSSRVCVSG